MTKKIPVAVLGATGAVGQRLVSLLDSHPWFETAELCASEKSAGKTYAEAATWLLPGGMPAKAAGIVVKPCDPAVVSSPLVFSALDSSVAGDAEEAFARAGRLVATNAKNHRMRADVPLVVPEVNPDHLGLAAEQPYGGGAILANPNCVTIGLVMALAPLAERFGIEAACMTSLQAASGAGYPGVPSLDLIDNVVPYIGGAEEEKLETEPRKILGSLSGKKVLDSAMNLSATCTRVPVLDGHSVSVSLKLGRPAMEGEIVAAWEGWAGAISSLGLPSAPPSPLIYRKERDRPQPRLDRDAGKGMAVSIGRLRPCPVLGWKFVLLSHNTLRGAAGGTILLAELAVAKRLCGLSKPV